MIDTQGYEHKLLQSSSIKLWSEAKSFLDSLQELNVSEAKEIQILDEPKLNDIQKSLTEMTLGVCQGGKDG